MTNSDMNDESMDRTVLLQRIELMESMIAAGRQSTMRNGWVFVIWGLVNLAGMGWQNFLPRSTWEWTWPVCLGLGIVITLLGKSLQQHQVGSATSMQCRSVEAVWGMMGITMTLYVGAALYTHFTWQYTYLSALMMIIGLAHAISGAILRWRIQGVVAGVWWAGGVAILFFNSSQAANDIFLLEMCFGMICFGLYIMLLEHRRLARERDHA